MSKPVTLDNVVDSVYTHCSVRSHTTKDVVTNILQDFGLVLTDEKLNQLIEVVRPYKINGKHLEKTCNSVYTILNSANTQSWSKDWNS